MSTSKKKVRTLAQVKADSAKQSVKKPAAQKKNKDKNVSFLTVVIVLGSLFYGINWLANNAGPRITAEQIEQERIEKAFNSWDGSHINLTRQIKESMHDPDSFEHVKTTYSKAGNGNLIVFNEFRGKNTLGVMVTNTAKAEADLAGNILKMLTP